MPYIKTGPDGQPVLVVYDPVLKLSHVAGVIPNTIHVITGRYSGGTMPDSTTAHTHEAHLMVYNKSHAALFPLGDGRTPFRNWPQNERGR